ncbi:hypothetical protein CK203_048922 [Vitis vinifera]|uniref:Uncharacterized protein n=1 Tax=Vitis vinifera TaxID=29760 RepID=A0A438GVI2_VITVI|nr:hypothetical protein CK203_048922 [Vitis vinifera]
MVESRPTVRKIRVDSRRWGRSGTIVKHALTRAWRWNRSVKETRHWYRQRRDREAGVMEEGKGLQAGPSNTWAVEGVGCVVNEGTLIKPKARVERSTGLLNPEQRMGWQEDNLGWLSNGDQDQETRAKNNSKGLRRAECRERPDIN